MIWTTATSARAALDRAEERWLRAGPAADAAAHEDLADAEAAFCAAVVVDMQNASRPPMTLPQMDEDVAQLLVVALSKLDLTPLDETSPAAALLGLINHLWSGGSLRPAYAPLTALYRRHEGP